jgi:hypothetical protein
VVFRPDSGKSEAVVALQHDGKPVLNCDAQAAPPITVDKAVYGVPGDPARTRDATSQVRELAVKGKTHFQPAILAQGGDPAPGVVKTLNVDYTVNNKAYHASATDWSFCILRADSPPSDAVLHYGADGQLWLESAMPGRFEVKTTSGKTSRIDIPALPRPIELAGPWKLSFPPGAGAPGLVNLESLISWSEHSDAGVKYFSGTAVYSKTFPIPGDFLGKNRRIDLDLGRVAVIAEVKLNGKDLGVLWKPPFRVDATDAVRAGDNALEIRVVNLWPNRLIGDEQLPEDSKRTLQATNEWMPAGNLLEWPEWVLQGKPSPTGRQTFSTWRLWKKTDPLLESGLLGPVTVSATERAACRF